MPNWCTNQLIVKGPDADILAFKTKAEGVSPWGPESETNPLNFHSLYPIPPEIIAAGYDDTGYQWERDHWGCKWGACETRLTEEWEGGLIYEFETAWSPPLPFLEHVAKDWSTLVFILDYEEPGIGFKGLARITAESCEDHCIEY